MKIFFFDTETTGKDPQIDQIIQFGGIFGIFDEGTNDFTEQYRINQLIKPSKEISEEASKVHGIYKKDLDDFGLIDDYIYEFLSFIKKADFVVGHNVEFDKSILIAETRRLGIPFDFSKVKWVDTMKPTSALLKIPAPERSKDKYKWPKLVQLHKFLFGKEFDNAHDAMSDIEATKDCFVELCKTYNFYSDYVLKDKLVIKLDNNLEQNIVYGDLHPAFQIDRWKDNEEAVKFLYLISKGENCIFLTGKAGSGKSTLLKDIISIAKLSNKLPIILGSTGISALNIGGKTIHSFFRIPLKPVYYKDYWKYNWKTKMSKNNVELLKKAPFIIIDEVSMVHSYLIDIVDMLLKFHLKNEKPFGGKQIIFVGDVYQLPPVRRPDRNQIFGDKYESEWFFHSECFFDLDYKVIELKKNYRQMNDATLTKILNDIREQNITDEDMSLLINCKHSNVEDDAIKLYPRRIFVEEYNRKQLEDIAGDEYILKAECIDSFPSELFPVDEEITIKVGCKVLMKSNDINNRWVNGSFGTVMAVNDYGYGPVSITIKIDGVNYEVERFSRLNTTYEIRKNNTYEEKVLGKYVQFPIQLAYAITIHKSQGLTFEQCQMNLEDIFAGGQAYTALSRVRSLDGLKIKGHIDKNIFFFDENVVEFSKLLKDKTNKVFKYNNDEYPINWHNNKNLEIQSENNLESEDVSFIKLDIQKVSGEQSTMDKQKQLHKKAYESWTQEDDNRLKDLFIEGKTIKELGDIFQRSKGGIRARLKKIGLDPDKQNNNELLKDTYKSEFKNLDEILFKKLKNCRLKIAKEKNMSPAYIIHNDVLCRIAAEKPRTRQEMIDIKGVGDRSFEIYGEKFLDIIKGDLDNILNIKESKIDNNKNDKQFEKKGKHRTENEINKGLLLIENGGTLNDLVIAIKRSPTAIITKLSEHGGFKILSDHFVESIMDCESIKGGSLSLPKLEVLSPYQADLLKDYDGKSILLGSLKELEDGVALSLSKFKGEKLYLDGVKKLSKKDAKCLSNFGGALLCLRGLDAVENGAIDELCKFNGELKLSEKFQKNN